MKKLYKVAILLIALFPSCKDETTNEELLTDSGWVVTAITVDPPVVVNNVVISDYYSQLYDYDKDNILRFRTDGTFESDEGALKEHPSDPQFQYGEWRFTENDAKLELNRLNDTIQYQLLNLSASELKMKYVERDSVTDILYSFTATFGHE
jgi:hypothetical protein